MENVKAHPVKTTHGADEAGNIYNIKTGRLMKQQKDQYGYYYFGSHRSAKFIYECFNGVKTDKNTVIDHIDNDKSNNSIKNLQEISQSDSIIKKYQNGYTKKGNNNISVEATNINTGETTKYDSIYLAGKVLNIVPASINRVIKGHQNTAISKNDGIKYSFKKL